MLCFVILSVSLSLCSPVDLSLCLSLSLSDSPRPCLSGPVGPHGDYRPSGGGTLSGEPGCEHVCFSVCVSVLFFCLFFQKTIRGIMRS